MKSFSLLAAPGLISLAGAVNMGAYVASKGVDAGFESYLQSLYYQAELSTATTGFTDFFTPDGQLIVLGNTATGASEILALKQKLMPPNGNKHWNHRPNITTVKSETATQKTFHVLGLIDTTYDGGNCSRAYYESEFPVKKNADGTITFKADVGNLITYNDLAVIPEKTPTDIPCE